MSKSEIVSGFFWIVAGTCTVLLFSLCMQLGHYDDGHDNGDGDNEQRVVSSDFAHLRHCGVDAIPKDEPRGVYRQDAKQRFNSLGTSE